MELKSNDVFVRFLFWVHCCFSNIVICMFEELGLIMKINFEFDYEEEKTGLDQYLESKFNNKLYWIGRGDDREYYLLNEEQYEHWRKQRQGILVEIYSSDEMHELITNIDVLYCSIQKV